MYIAFYNASKNDSLFSLPRLISILSGGKYSHCEIVTSYGKSFSMSPKTFRGRFIDFRDVEDCDKYDKIKLKVTKSQEVLIFSELLKYDGAKYDWFGAMFSVFNTCRLQDKGRFFCSEVIVDVLKSNIPKYEWLSDGCKTSPVDLYNELISHK